MKASERIWGQAQHEIANLTGKLVSNYTWHVSQASSWHLPECLTSGKGCQKGGCAFGPRKALDRLV